MSQPSKDNDSNSIPHWGMQPQEPYFDFLNQIGVANNGVTVKYHDDKSRADRGRCVFATKDFAAGDVLFSLPKTSFISEATARKDEKFSVIANELEEHFATLPKSEIRQKKISGDFILSLYLLYQKIIGEDSLLHPFIKALPTHFCRPICWETEELAELKNTNVPRMTLLFKEQLHQLYKDTYVDFLFVKYSSIFSELTASFDDMIWAYCAISTRRIEGPGSPSGSPNPNDKESFFIIPLADMLNHSLTPNANHQYVSDYGDDAAADAGNDRIIRKKGKGKGKGKGKKGKKNPLITFECAALKDITKGEEIHISYGDIAGQRLLEMWGFYEKDNPYEVIDIGIHIPDEDPLKQKKLDLYASIGINPQYIQLSSIKGAQDFISAARIYLLEAEDFKDTRTVLAASLGRAYSVSAEHQVFEITKNELLAQMQMYSSENNEDRTLLIDGTTPHKTLALKLKMGNKRILIDCLRHIYHWFRCVCVTHTVERSLDECDMLRVLTMPSMCGNCKKVAHNRKEEKEKEEKEKEEEEKEKEEEKEEVKLMRCVRCKFQGYCSKECQKAHWNKHKKVCEIVTLHDEQDDKDGAEKDEKGEEKAEEEE